MRARDATGKRITKVAQRRVQTNTGVAWDVYGLILEDGTVLVPVVRETPGDYAIEIFTTKAKKKKEEE